MNRVLHTLATLTLAALAATVFAQDDDAEAPPELRLLNSADLASACYAQMAISGLELVRRTESAPDDALRARITLLFVGAQFWAAGMRESEEDAVAHWGPGILAEELEDRLPQLAFCGDIAGHALNEMPPEQLRETLAHGGKEAERALRLRPSGHG